jgi:hypothetical protein
MHLLSQQCYSVSIIATCMLILIIYNQFVSSFNDPVVDIFVVYQYRPKDLSDRNVPQVVSVCKQVFQFVVIV